MYTSIWTICGMVGVVILCFSQLRRIVKFFAKVNVLVWIGLFFLGILGGGFTLAFAIILTLLVKDK